MSLINEVAYALLVLISLMEVISDLPQASGSFKTFLLGRTRELAQYTIWIQQ